MDSVTTTTTTSLADSRLFEQGGKSGYGYQAFHLAQPGVPVWAVLVVATAVSVVALAGIVLLRRSARA